MMGPKDTENVFGTEDLQPYCKFCFAKKFKVSAINIAETVAIAPEINIMGLWISLRTLCFYYAQSAADLWYKSSSNEKKYIS